MIRHDETTGAPAIELRYCFLCDADGHHLSVEVEGLYVFQCSACFASHTEPLPGVVAAGGRHRMGAERLGIR